MKKLISGMVILGAFWLVWQLVKVVAFLAWLLFPVLLVVAVLYGIGTLAPKDVLNATEARIRDGLDWLDFHAPSWSWSTVRMAREGLDWMGLHVKKT